MPSQEYCEDLLEKENEELDEAQDALDEYNKAIDDMEAAAEDTMGSAAKAGGHGLGGDWTDAFADIIDMVKGDSDFDRASSEVGRAQAKWEREEEQRARAMRKWCEECGDPPEDEGEDSAGASRVDFSEDEVDPIIGYPGGRGWD